MYEILTSSQEKYKSNWDAMEKWDIFTKTGVLKCDLVSVLAGSVSFSFALLNLGMALRDDAGIRTRAQTLIFFM